MKVTSRQWEARVEREPTDVWPLMPVYSRFFGPTIEPDTVEVVWAARDGEAPALLPVDVSGWVTGAHPPARSSLDRALQTDQLPAWLRSVVSVAAASVGIEMHPAAYALPPKPLTVIPGGDPQ